MGKEQQFEKNRVEIERLLQDANQFKPLKHRIKIVKYIETPKTFFKKDKQLIKKVVQPQKTKKNKVEVQRLLEDAQKFNPLSKRIIIKPKFLQPKKTAKIKISKEKSSKPPSAEKSLKSSLKKEDVNLQKPKKSLSVSFGGAVQNEANIEQQNKLLPDQQMTKKVKSPSNNRQTNQKHQSVEIKRLLEDANLFKPLNNRKSPDKSESPKKQDPIPKRKTNNSPSKPKESPKNSKLNSNIQQNQKSQEKVQVVQNQVRQYQQKVEKPQNNQSKSVEIQRLLEDAQQFKPLNKRIFSPKPTKQVLQLPKFKKLSNELKKISEKVKSNLVQKSRSPQRFNSAQKSRSPQESNVTQKSVSTSRSRSPQKSRSPPKSKSPQPLPIKKLPISKKQKTYQSIKQKNKDIQIKIEENQKKLWQKVNQIVQKTQKKISVEYKRLMEDASKFNPLSRNNKKEQQYQQIHRPKQQLPEIKKKIIPKFNKKIQKVKNTNIIRQSETKNTNNNPQSQIKTTSVHLQRLLQDANQFQPLSKRINMRNQ